TRIPGLLDLVLTITPDVVVHPRRAREEHLDPAVGVHPEHGDVRVLFAADEHARLVTGPVRALPVAPGSPVGCRMRQARTERQSGDEDVVNEHESPESPLGAENMPADRFASGTWKPMLNNELRTWGKTDRGPGVSWPGRSGVR